MPTTLARQQRLFTADEYHAMARAGILGEDDRIELIDGKIIPMSPIGGRHLYCVNRLNQLFGARLYAGGAPPAVVSVQNPVRLGPYQEPEPDVVLLRPAADRAAVPRPEDVLLLVEVADTTLAFDREVKVPRYAAAGIPEVWIVALQEEHVEVYRGPQPEGYAEVVRRAPGETLTVAALPHVEPIPVDELL